MTYTQDDLVNQLDELGYPMTKRRLTDWVQKGLLPPLRDHGRGQGRGKVYQWEEPDILHRAIDVAELLDWHRRAADLVLALWVLGYDVPLPEVRSGLRRFVDGLSAGIDAAIPFRGDRADLISDLLVIAEEQFRAQRNDLPIEIVAPLVHGFIDPETRDWAELVDAVHQELSTGEDGDAAWPDPDGAERAATFVRDQLSMPRLQAAVEQATDEDLALVHGDLRAVMHAARAVASVGIDIEPWVLIRLLVHVGTRGAVLDLALRHGGHGDMVDRLTGRFTDICHRLLTDPRLRVELQRVRLEQGALASVEGENTRDAMT